MNPSQQYTALPCTPDDVYFLNRAITDYNASRVPFTQEQPFVSINLAVKNADGQVIAGVLAVLYCWGCLYIDILWVAEDYRRQGYGSYLLTLVEDQAYQTGCTLAHLDTFDFQAKDFYLKHGYTVFGELEGCPSGHTRYYLQKRMG